LFLPEKGVREEEEEEEEEDGEDVYLVGLFRQGNTGVGKRD
jgi:hypothetical protein